MKIISRKDYNPVQSGFYSGSVVESNGVLYMVVFHVDFGYSLVSLKSGQMIYSGYYENIMELADAEDIRLVQVAELIVRN